MSYFLRALYNNVFWEPDAFPFLNQGELPSCITADLRADDNALSLWEIPDDKSNIPHVMAAIASRSRTSIEKKNYDYAIIEKDILESEFIKPRNSSSNTPYIDMNHYHFHIPELTLDDIVSFAKILAKYGDFDTVGWKGIISALEEARDNSRLDVSKMNKSLIQQLHMSL